VTRSHANNAARSSTASEHTSITSSRSKTAEQMMTPIFKRFVMLIMEGKRERSSADVVTSSVSDWQVGVGHFANPVGNGRPHAKSARISESCRSFLEAPNG